MFGRVSFERRSKTWRPLPSLSAWPTWWWRSRASCWPPYRLLSPLSGSLSWHRYKHLKTFFGSSGGRYEVGVKKLNFVICSLVIMASAGIFAGGGGQFFFIFSGGRQNLMPVKRHQKPLKITSLLIQRRGKCHHCHPLATPMLEMVASRPHDLFCPRLGVGNLNLKKLCWVFPYRPIFGPP